MLQVKPRSSGPLKIKSIRKADEKDPELPGASCSIGPGDGTDKPPC
jgi:hypothetical protein